MRGSKTLTGEIALNKTSEKLSFVIPCYNSEHTLESTIHNIHQEMQKLKEYIYEIILVNDGSPDGVFSVIEKICLADKSIKALDLARNFGQHNAIMAGFSVVTGDFIIGIDDDGQQPLEFLYMLLEKIKEGYDVVFGADSGKKNGFVRSIGSSIHDWMGVSFMGKPCDVQFSSFFIARRYVIQEIINYKNPYPFLSGLLLRSCGRVASIKMPFTKREGKSGYSFKKLISVWLNGFTAFSIKPLRVATFLGILCALVGFFAAVYTIIYKIINPSVLSGYTSLISVILLTSGLIMLILGFIGEYIGRIYISINNSPQYIIRQYCNVDISQDTNRI